MSEKTPLTFEQKLEQLELLVKKLETGELELAQSLATFEEGVALLKTLEAELTTAQAKITKVLEKPE